MSSVPDLRISKLTQTPIRSEGDFVLYWMMGARRASYNFALDQAVSYAENLNKPLVIFEDLRCGFELSSKRMHAFMIEGMLANQEVFNDRAVTYIPAVEEKIGENEKVLSALCKKSCLVIVDEFPSFILPKIRADFIEKNPKTYFESVDTNGLLPMRAVSQTFPTAYAFRRYLQKNIMAHLLEFPQADALKNKKLSKLKTLGIEFNKRELSEYKEWIDQIPFQEKVEISPIKGGGYEANKVLKNFINNKLKFYGEMRSHPDLEMQSGFSPYLHFGHIGVHKIFKALAEKESWSVKKLSTKASGKKKAGGECLQALKLF